MHKVQAQDDSDYDHKQATKPEPNAAGLLPGDDIIDSDLDDSDDELKDGEEDGGGEGGEVDIVFCVYDKVGLGVGFCCGALTIRSFTHSLRRCNA